MQTLINQHDIAEFTKAPSTIGSQIWKPAYYYVEESKLPGLLPTTLIADLKALDRERDSGELHDFWKDYLRRWMAVEVFLDASADHGIGVGPHGNPVFVATENTSRQANTQEVARIVARLTSHAESYRQAMIRRIYVEMSGVIEGKEYPDIDNELYEGGRPRKHINAIGGVFERLSSDDVNRNRL